MTFFPLAADPAPATTIPKLPVLLIISTVLVGGIMLFGAAKKSRPLNSRPRQPEPEIGPDLEPEKDRPLPKDWDYDYMINPCRRSRSRRGRRRNPPKQASQKDINEAIARMRPMIAKDTGEPLVVLGGYECAERGLIHRLESIKKDGDYGCDPLGNGKFRMVPSGDIVDYEERCRRLRGRTNPGRSRRAGAWRTASKAGRELAALCDARTSDPRHLANARRIFRAAKTAGHVF